MGIGKRAWIYAVDQGVDETIKDLVLTACHAFDIDTDHLRILEETNLLDDEYSLDSP